MRFAKCLEKRRGIWMKSVMDEKEVERMINAAGLIGAIIGFISGAGLMMMVGIIF
mgnify:CR=1 FL=1